MELKLEVYKQTLDSFSYLANTDFSALQSILDPRLIDGLENGLIQKFEIITEQSWKLAKAFLYQQDGVDSKTPKQSIKNFFNAGYLEEESYLLWMQALEDRNVLGHRYDEEAYQNALGRMKRYSVFYLRLFNMVFASAQSPSLEKRG